MRYWKHEDLCQIEGFAFHIFYGQFGSREWEPHAHEFGELVLIVSGRGDHLTETGDWPLAPGDIFYIRPEEVHGYRNLQDMHYCNISFDPRAFLGPFPELTTLPGYHALFQVEPKLRQEQGFVQKLNLRGGALHTAVDLIEQMRTEYEADMPGRETRIRCLLVLLVTHLARYYSISNGSGSRAVINLSRVIAFVETKYADGISLDGLADAACMSKSSLMRAFQQCYHTSPLHYLNEFRLKKAAERLSRETLSVTRIAGDVGFADPSYFSRLFRRSYGMSPREYRRNRVSRPGMPT